MATLLEASRPIWAPGALLALALSFAFPAAAEAAATEGAAAEAAAAEAPPAAPSNSAVARAEQLAARAFEAYQQGRHADAVALYEQAYASAPSADALYNIARIYDIGLRDRENALAAYERCLLEPGASPERLERAGKRIVQLRNAAPAALPAQSWPAELKARAPSPAPAASGQRWPWLRGAAVLAAATGVVGLGVGLGFGVAASSDARRANADCEGNLCRSQRGVDAARSASNRALLATTGVGTGLALLVSGATLWLLEDGGATGGEAPREARRPTRLTPMASARELGMSFEGSW